jgi:hypothetical protein
MVRRMKKTNTVAKVGQTPLADKPPAKPDVKPYVQASANASGVPLKVEDAGTVAAVVTFVRSATRAK